MKIHVAARVGNYQGDVGELAKKYSPSFMRFPVGDPNVVKYGFQVKDSKGFRLVMISSCNLEFEGQGYNMMLTVQGTNTDQVNRQMADLEKRLGVELRDAPERVKQQQETIAKLLGKLLA